MNLPPLFNAQFIDDDGTPLASGKLYTYVSGTTTNQTTYQSEGGTSNANPIILDAAGRCNLWLDPTLVYTFKLDRSDDTTVFTRDDIYAAADASAVVTSVNSLTGAVSLTAADIPFTTGTATDWFVGTDVATALDAIIDNFTGTTAASIPIVDAGSKYVATNVETALQEVKTIADSAAAGLTTAGTGTSTQSAEGTATFPSGLIMKWGTTSTISVDTADTAVTFAVAFPNNCFVVTGTPSTANGASGGGERYSIGIHTFTTAGFKVDNDSFATTVSWIAIGN